MKILDGKYRIERTIGIALAVAHHIQLDEKVLLRFFEPPPLGNSNDVARFTGDVKAGVKIKSEHVQRVLDVGTLPNGGRYMVIEYLEGRDLDAWLRERGPLPIEQAVEFVLQACEAIAEAHALGVVHQDLKPANLYCVRRADGRLSIKVSGGWTVIGTPLYMSPEQMRSPETVDSRTDIWTFGILLFELITGEHPFPFKGNMREFFQCVILAPPKPIRQTRPEVPTGLEAVILRCLEKNRDQRYRDVAELALALLPFAPKEGLWSLWDSPVSLPISYL